MSRGGILALVGFVAGLLLGSPFGAEAAVGGALIGLVIGAVLGALQKGQTATALPATAEERLAVLERQVDWLHRESQRLRAELAALRGDGPAAPAAPRAVVEVPVPAAAAPAPPMFVDETPTQPGIDFVPPAPPAAAAPTLGQRLFAGNILAKIGVVLLFFGVASALRLAADYGYLPVSLRLLLGAVAGLAMIAFGWHKVRAGSHQTFGVAIQGGGFAILYLIVYFMLARYGLLSAAASFALFALLGVACVLLAAVQEGVFLAVFGLAGAFAAPVLAAGGSGDPLPLFGYFALLNAFIVGVSWFKIWRLLNVTGFLFTLGVGMAWGVEHYHAGHHDVTQGFVFFFWALYAATPVVTAWFKAPGWAGWSDATLVFGTPLVGFALQSQLAADRFELAWAALAVGLAYGALWLALFRRGDEEMRLLERCQLGLALTFATLAVPLGLGVRVSAAFWALEGVAVLWFGVVQQRRLAMATGALLQVGAAVFFALAFPDLRPTLAVINDVCLGAALLAGAGYASARLLRRHGEGAAALALLWALVWWVLAGTYEIDRLTADPVGIPLTLLFVALTLAALDGVGRRDAWTAARQLGFLLLPVLWFAAGTTFERTQHMLAGLMVLALPLGMATHYWLLARQEADGAEFWPTLRHVGGFWLLVMLVSVELAWTGHHLAPGVRLWPLLGLAVGPILGLWGAARGVGRQLPPVAGHEFAYLGLGSVVPALVLAVWSLWANFAHSGDGSGLPYLPLLNPFDLVQLAALGSLYAWLRALRRQALPGVPALPPAAVGGLGFVWFSCLAGRITHQWADVPFTAHSLWHSTPFQALLTLLWTGLAIAAMIGAARLRVRRLWQGGFALLAVVGVKLMAVDLANAGTLVWTGSLIGVALLVLAAAYFAPAPPAAPEGEAER